MVIITDFSYATIGILCLLFVAYFSRRNTLQKSGKYFFMNLIVLSIITFTNHFLAISLRRVSEPPYDTFSEPKFYTLIIISILGYSVFYVLSMLYVYSILRVGTFPQKLKYAIIGFLCLSNLLIILTPFTKMIFYFEGTRFVATPGYVIVYILMMSVYICFQLYLIHKYGNNVKHHQKISLYCVVVFMFIAFVMQITLIDYQPGCIICALIMIFLFSSIEDPSEYYYRYNKCFNEYAFRMIAREKFNTYKIFSIGFIGIENFSQMSMFFNRETIEKIELSLIKGLSETFGKKNIFYLGNEIFAILIDKEAENAISVAYDKAKDVCLSIGFDLPIEPYVSMLEYDGYRSQHDVFTALEIFKNYKPQAGKDKRFFMIDEKNFLAFERENKVVNAIKTALKYDNFLVYYQPIYDEEQDRYTSCEALLRLSDKELGMIYPSEFIPIAEKYGLIGEVGEKMFSLVCKSLKKNNLKALGLVFIQINISASQCVGNKLAKMLIDTCARYEISPETFNIEISESACTRDKGMILENILALKRRGMTFSIDNFGCVFSSADKITSFPVKYVKFDKETIWSSTDKQDSKAILSHLVMMVRELGYRSVACGVETEALYRLLKQLGFNYFQGFYFSKPIPEADYIMFLKEHNKY